MSGDEPPGAPGRVDPAGVQGRAEPVGAPDRGGPAGAAGRGEPTSLPAGPVRGRWRRWLAAAVLVAPVLRWAVLVHSVPAGAPWRSRCGGPEPVAEPGAAPDGVPAGCPVPVGPDGGLSRLLPPARCGRCGRRTGAPPYLLEVAALVAAAAVVVAVAGGGWSPWAATAVAGWAGFAVPLTFIDLAVHRLPDRLTLPAAGWVLAWLGVAAAGAGDGRDWLRAATAAAVCGLAFAAVTLVFGSRGFGLGDAKMVLGIGALLGWLGWTAVVLGLLLAFLGSGLVAAVLLVTRRVGRQDALPFGPFLVAGALAALAWVGLSG